MSEARTVWKSLETRRAMLVVGLLCAMAAAEVLFLYFIGGPNGAAMVQAAEGIVAPE